MKRTNKTQAPVEVILVASTASTGVAVAGTAASGVVNVPAQSGLTTGTLVTLSDGVSTAVFEFTLDGGLPTPGNIQVNIATNDDATATGDAFAAAVNASSLNLTASNDAGAVTVTNTIPGSHGNVTWTDDGEITFTQPTGGTDFETTGASITGLADGQLAIINRDPSAGVRVGNFLNSVNAAQCDAIEVIQGTSNSATLGSVSVFGDTAPAFYRSGIIRADKVKSVSTTTFEVGSYHAVLMNPGTAPTEKIAYKMSVVSRSHARDISYTQWKDDEVAVSVTVPEGTTAGTDYLLQNWALKLNQSSKLVNGNKPFVVLGLNDAGTGNASAETVLNTIDKGDVINFMKDSTGKQYSITVDIDMVQTLKNIIANTGIDIDTTIVNMNDTGNTTPGAAANVDRLLVIGLSEDYAVYDDSIMDRVRVSVGTDLTNVTITDTASSPRDANSTGRQWKQRFLDRMAMQNSGNLQRVGHVYDFTANDIPTSISETAYYTATIIEFEEDSVTINNNVPYEHRLVIITPATVADETLDVGGNAFSVSTTNSTTVASLNATLGKWLASASDTYNRIQYHGLATKAAPFV